MKVCGNGRIHVRKCILNKINKIIILLALVGCLQSCGQGALTDDGVQDFDNTTVDGAVETSQGEIPALKRIYSEEQRDYDADGEVDVVIASSFDGNDRLVVKTVTDYRGEEASETTTLFSYDAQGHLNFVETDESATELEVSYSEEGFPVHVEEFVEEELTYTIDREFSEETVAESIFNASGELKFYNVMTYSQDVTLAGYLTSSTLTTLVQVSIEGFDVTGRYYGTARKEETTRDEFGEIDSLTVTTSNSWLVSDVIAEFDVIFSDNQEVSVANYEYTRGYDGYAHVLYEGIQSADGWVYVALQSNTYDDGSVTAATNADGDTVAAELDCNDESSDDLAPLPEVCDGVDNDCDGEIDNGFELTDYFLDQDQDGFGDSETITSSCEELEGYVTNDFDCDDSVWDKSVADDCDAVLYYPDRDGDGYGSSAATGSETMIESVISYVTNNEDCNDNNDAVHPDAYEKKNGIDDDCDGTVDEWGLVKVVPIAPEGLVDILTVKPKAARPRY